MFNSWTLVVALTSAVAAGCSAGAAARHGDRAAGDRGVRNGLAGSGELRSAAPVQRAESRDVAPGISLAFELLLKSNSFSYAGTGFHGGRSAEIDGFAKVAGDPDADSLFKDLFERGRPAGQLFALCGLYRTDRPTFDRLVRSMEGSKKTVEVSVGCSTDDDMPVGLLILNPDPRTVQLRSGTTIEASLAENPERRYLDFRGGGIPAAMFSYLERAAPK